MMTTIALIYVMCLIGMYCKCTNTAVPSLASISAEAQKVALRTKQRVRRNIMQISDYGGHGSAPNGSYGGPGAHYHSGSQGNYSGPDQGCPYCNPNGYSQGPAPKAGQQGWAGPCFYDNGYQYNQGNMYYVDDRSKAEKYSDFVWEIITDTGDFDFRTGITAIDVITGTIGALIVLIVFLAIAALVLFVAYVGIRLICSIIP